MSYWISLHARLSPSEEDTQENLLACWDTDLFLFPLADKLAEMVEAGKAKQTKFDYYPCAYSGSAGDLLPLLLQSLTQAHERAIQVKHQDRIERCPPDAELHIAIWDNS